MWADKTEGQVQRRQGCTEEGVPNICDFGVPDIGNQNPIMALHEHRPSSKYSLLLCFVGPHPSYRSPSITTHIVKTFLCSMPVSWSSEYFELGRCSCSAMIGFFFRYLEPQNHKYLERLLQCSLVGVVLGPLFCRPTPLVLLTVNIHAHCGYFLMIFAGLVEQRVF